MGIMNAPMMLAASSGDDVDFMVHGLIPLKFFGHKVWITTTHVTTLIVMVFIIVLALIARHAVLHGDEKPSGLQNFLQYIGIIWLKTTDSGLWNDACISVDHICTDPVQCI